MGELKPKKAVHPYLVILGKFLPHFFGGLGILIAIFALPFSFFADPVLGVFLAVSAIPVSAISSVRVMIRINY
jgi:hypothetical protein